MKTQKQKIVILILILLFTIGIISYVLIERNKINNQNLDAGNVQPNEQIKNENKDSQPVEVSLLTYEGTFSELQEGSLVIKNGETENTIDTDQNASVFQIIDGKVVEKKLDDLKKGAKIKIGVRQTDSRIISIEIEK